MPIIPIPQLVVPIGFSLGDPDKLISLEEFDRESLIIPFNELTDTQKKHLTTERIRLDPSFRFSLLSISKIGEFGVEEAIIEVRRGTSVGLLIIEFERIKAELQRLAKLGDDPPNFDLEDVRPISGPSVSEKFFLLDISSSGFGDVFDARKQIYRNKLPSSIRIHHDEFEFDEVLEELNQPTRVDFGAVAGSAHGGLCNFNDQNNNYMFTCDNIDSLSDVLKNKIIHLFGCDCGGDSGLGEKLVDHLKVTAFLGYRGKIFNSENVAISDAAGFEALSKGLTVTESAIHVRNRYRINARAAFEISDFQESAELMFSLGHFRLITNHPDAALH